MTRLELDPCCSFVYRLALQKQVSRYLSTLEQGVSLWQRLMAAGQRA